MEEAKLFCKTISTVQDNFFDGCIFLDVLRGILLSILRFMGKFSVCSNYINLCCIFCFCFLCSIPGKFFWGLSLSFPVRKYF
jgi:hypothetical protein